MTNNEYIKTYSNIELDGNTVTVTLCVPPRKVVTFTHQESEETKHVAIFTEHVIIYLGSIGMTDISVLQPASTNNNHPRALTATWVFSAKQAPSRSRRKTTKTK